jgi:hypothetical protein
MTRLLLLLTTAAVAWLIAPADGRANPGAPSREYQVKAAFVSNFVQFVEWPATAFNGANDPIVVAVVGDNPFGPALEQAVRGKSARGREIRVRYARNVAQAVAAGPTHVLYIAPAAGEKPPAQAVRDAAATGRLTIADVDDFVAAGGCVQFFADDNKMRFTINTSALNRAGLRASSKLLQLAKVYKEEG